MNAERLLLVTSTIQAEMQRIRLTKLLQAVIDAVNNNVNQPNNENLNNISNALNNLEQQLAGSSLNRLPQTWTPIVEDLALADLLGSQLATQVREIIARRQPLWNEAVSEIQGLKSRLDNALTAFTEVNSGLTKLGVNKTELGSGEAELSVVIPREIFGNRWDAFLAEGRLIDRLVKTCSVIATGSSDSAQVKQLSTTDPMVILVATPAAIMFILKAVNMILDAYQKVLAIRETKTKAEAAGLDAKIVKSIEAEATKRIQEHVDSFIDEVRRAKAALEPTTLNGELTSLHDILLKIAARLDRGMRIEGAAEPGGEDSQVSAELREQLTQIQQAALQARHFPVSGPPILGLPAPSPADADDIERKV